MLIEQSKDRYPEVSAKLDDQIAECLEGKQELNQAGLGYSLRDMTRRVKGVRAHVRVGIGRGPRNLIEIGYVPGDFPYGWKRLKPPRNAVRHNLNGRGMEEFEIKY